MSSENTSFTVSPNVGILREEAVASSDDQLEALWLHGRPGHTQRAYRADAARFRARARKPLAQVTLRDLQMFADSLSGAAPASRYRCLSSIKSLLAFGHRIGYLLFDVGRVLRLPTVRDTLAERILPEGDLHRLLTLEPNARNRALLTLLYAAGVRRGEVADLRWRDLQTAGDGGQVTVFGKGGKTRSIQLPVSLWWQLQNLRQKAEENGAIFPSRRRGTPLSGSAIWRIVHRAALRSGLTLPVSPHWLRHAHASHALDRGAPIHLVKATLGHASITTTGRYLHARPKESSSRFLPL